MSRNTKIILIIIVLCIFSALFIMLIARPSYHKAIKLTAPCPVPTTVLVTDKEAFIEKRSQYEKLWPECPVFLIMFYDSTNVEKIYGKRYKFVREIESLQKSIHPVENNIVQETHTDHLLITHGVDLKRVEGYLNGITKSIGNSRWEKMGNGYVINIGEHQSGIQPINYPITNSDIFVPTISLLSPNFHRSFEFLSKITSIEILVEASNPVEVVEHIESLPSAGIPYSGEQYQFETPSATTFMNLIINLAKFHGCIAHQEDNKIIIRDPAPDGMQERVADFIRNELHADSNIHMRVKALPPGADKELVKYLDSPDIDVVQITIEALMELNSSIGKEKLFSLFQAKHLSNGEEINEWSLKDMAKHLFLLGEDNVIPTMTEKVKCGEKYDKMNMILLLGQGKSEPAATAQTDLIRSNRPITPTVIPGEIKIKDIPPNITTNEVAKLQQLALDFINGFMDPRLDEDISAYFEFAPDGNSAKYTLSIGYYHGPLAAGAMEYIIEFKRCNNFWFIINKDESHWFS